MAFDGKSAVVSFATKKDEEARVGIGAADDVPSTADIALSSRDGSCSSGEQSAITPAPELTLTSRRFMGFAAMAMLWTASQVPLYFFGKLKCLQTF